MWNVKQKATNKQNKETNSDKYQSKEVTREKERWGDDERLKGSSIW